MKKIVVLLILFFWVMPVYANEKVEVIFSKCVDGDTAKFILNDDVITARFLAIDTPETVHPTKGEEPFGKEASNYTCEKLTNAKKIVLEYDNGSNKLDKYQRHLVWVYYDDNFLQEELLRLGYAKVAYLYGKYQYTSDLQDIELIAKSNKVGIWSDYLFEDVANEYTVTFSYNKKKEKLKVFEGGIVNPINSPIKEGYKFTGWYLDDEIFDFSTPINKDIKLVAKFEKIEDEIPIYVYIIGGIVLIFILVTNYNGKRTKLERKLKHSIKKKLMKS